MSLKVKGIITYIEHRTNGYMLRLNTRIWAFVPIKKIEHREPLISYGNTITLVGTPHHNGRREILYVDSIEQNSIFELQKVIERLKLTESDKRRFLAYLYRFSPSFYKKFIKWSYSKQSLYFMNPFKLYLNNHLDYHTSKALADVVAIKDKEKMVPAIARYLLEEALYTKKNYTFQTLVETIQSKYPDVSSTDVANYANHAGISIQGNTVTLSKMFYLKKRCLDMIANNIAPPMQAHNLIQSLIPELSQFLKYRYFCVVGGAGSGKSTLALKLREVPTVMLTATTGKAAERLGVNTVHKLLGFGKNGFTVKKLDCEMLVVDEASTLDWKTLFAILKAVPSVVFVGDPKQLPPVEGESVFNTLVTMLPTYNLTTQYRQTEHKIVCWSKIPDLDSIFNIYKSSLPSVQILTPLVVGPYGTDRINKFIQSRLYNTQDIVPGTRIIMNKNIYNYDKLIASNGSIGVVKSIGDKFYRVQTSDATFWCKESDFSLSYALTIHRAQGSEWDYVIVIFPEVTKEGILTEELKRVALTRARTKTFVFEEEKQQQKTIKQ